MNSIRYTIWFNRKDLKVRDEVLMNRIYFVKDYTVEDNLEMLSVKFQAPFADRTTIMDNAFRIGATIVTLGEQDTPFFNKEKLKKNS